MRVLKPSSSSRAGREVWEPNRESSGLVSWMWASLRRQLRYFVSRCLLLVE